MLKQPPECLAVAFYTLFTFIASLIPDFFRSFHWSCVSPAMVGFKVANFGALS